jgi:hypothetical protein
VGFLDAILGRTKQAKPNLDALFSVPTAALTLEAAAEMHATGVGAVCFREMEGGPFARLKDEMTALLGGTEPEEHRDRFGYTWMVIRHDPRDVSGLVTHLHAANTTLEGSGFGPALLCSTIGFTSSDGKPLALVYLYKQGTFYPFAPTSERAQERNSGLELQVRAMISGELPIEEDLSRWFPVWGAPGL